MRRVEREKEGRWWAFSETTSTDTLQCCRESYTTGVSLNRKGSLVDTADREWVFF